MDNGARKFIGEDNVAIQLLGYAAKAGVNISITGTTGHGKTTLLEELVDFVPQTRTLVVLQDFREIRLQEKYPHRNILEIEPGGTVSESMTLIKSASDTSDLPVIIIGKVPSPELLKIVASVAGITVLMFEYPTHTEQGLIDTMPKALVDQGLVPSLKRGEDITASAVHLSVHVTRSSSGKYFISHINEVMQKVSADSPTIVGRNVIAYMQTEGRHVTTGCLSYSLVQRIAELLGTEEESREFMAFLDEQWGR